MKFTKKIIAAFVLSALLLAGCTPGGGTEPELNQPQQTLPTQPTAPTVSAQPTAPEYTQSMVFLSADQIQQIENDWYTATGSALGVWGDVESATEGVRYYGTYDGYDILFRPIHGEAETQLVIEDITFVHNNIFEIYSYRDGSFTLLRDLCQDGVLNMAAIRTISTFHMDYETRMTDGNTPSISVDAEELMKLAFLEKYAANTQYTTGDLTVNYFAQYGQAHVGFNNGILIYTQAITTEEVAGVTFRYSTGQKLQMYFEGELMSLSEAYDRGILSREDLLAIHNAYTPKNDSYVTE